MCGVFLECFCLLMCTSLFISVLLFELLLFVLSLLEMLNLLTVFSTPHKNPNNNARTCLSYIIVIKYRISVNDVLHVHVF